MATLLRRVPNLCRDAAHFSKQADARLQRALDDLEVAQPKLDASELEVGELLHGQVLKFRFLLPRVDSESLCEESQIQLRQARTSSLVALETEALNGHYETSNYQEELWSILRSMKELGIAALASCCLTLALSYSSMDVRVSALLGGIFSWLVQLLALAQTWSRQVKSVFETLNRATHRIISNLDEPVSRYGQKAVQPLEALEAAIDKLEMEQAIVLKRMKEFQEQVRDAIPDFEVPSVEPMREPILDCHASVGSFLEETKGALPEELKSLLARHSTGSMVMERSRFECRFVHLPLILVILLNLAALIGSQALVLQWSQPPPPVEHRMTRGFEEILPNIHFTVEEHGRPPPAGPSRHFVVFPTAFQVLLSTLELIAGLGLTRSPHLLSFLGAMTADLEKGCNSWIEKHGKGISAEVFGTFGQVQKHSERFFPTFRLRLGQLRSFLLAGAKAEKANGVFGRAGSLFPEDPNL